MSSPHWLEQVRRWTNGAAKRGRQGRRSERRQNTHLPWVESLEGRLAPAVTLSISNREPFAEGDFGTSKATVTRSGDLASAEQLFHNPRQHRLLATSRTLFFGSNQTTATITVPIIGITLSQSNRILYATGS